MMLKRSAEDERHGPIWLCGLPDAFVRSTSSIHQHSDTDKPGDPWGSQVITKLVSENISGILVVLLVAPSEHTSGHPVPVQLQVK